MTTSLDGTDLRCLRLRCRRPEETAGASSSLFARLSPSAVTALQKDALLRSQPQNQNGWHIFTANDKGRTDFLPLAVTFRGRSEETTTIYVSYNGGDAATYRGNENSEDILELPPALIPDGCLEQGDDNRIVHVKALSFVRDAQILQVEPSTTADWELLETRAAFLEDGALLQQVSIVYAGQVIPLWVGFKDVAWIRILSVNFEREDSVWPELDAGPGCQSTATECLRLVRDTRISVAPKPRLHTSQSSPPLRVYTTQNDYGTPMLNLAESMGKRQVSTTPGTVLIHSALKAQIPGLQDDDENALVLLWNAANESAPPDANLSIVLQLQFCVDIPERHIAIHPLTRSRLDLVALRDAVFLRLLSPVEVARGSSCLGEEDALSLEMVDLQSLRQGKKWRYPYDDLSRQQNNPILLSKENITGAQNEPMENGSFLFENTPTMVRTLYRVSISSDHVPSTDRCFVRRKDLSEQVHNNTSQPCVSYNVLSSPQLLDLLPWSSRLSSDLNHYKIHSSINFDALVYGENGSGKTHTALSLASFARFTGNCSTLYLDCKKLKEGRGTRMKQIQSEFDQVFHEVSACVGHVLVILDDLDELAPNMINGASSDDSSQSQQVNPVAVDQAKLVADTVCRYIEQEPRSAEKKISVLITCRDTRSLHPALLTARPFTRSIPTLELTALEKGELLLKMILPPLDLGAVSLTSAFSELLLGRRIDGYRPKDLSLLASRVKHMLQCDGDGFSQDNVARCVKLALEDFTPLRQLSVNEGTAGAAAWSDIGGLFKAKEALTSAMLNPSKYRRIYSKAAIRLPRGVLLFGSPGSGKSFLVPALAKKCGFSLITCRGPELLDRYIGASESKVRELFARAAAASPSILFFDEIDSLAPRRGSDRTGVTDRVVNQLLTLVDGVEDVSAGGLVYVVAATSRPDIIDPALLRPGRLENHVYVGYPESDVELTDLLLKVSSRFSVDKAVLQSLSTPQFMQDLKKACPSFHRFSAADFKAVFDTAQLYAIHELLQTDRSNENVVIEDHHLMEALRSTGPSLPERDFGVLMKSYRPFRKDVKGQASDGDSLHSRNKLRTALR